MLEIELQKNETRQNRKRMEALLHADFMEFGRSGKIWSSAEILAEFGAGHVLSAVESRNFELVLLAQDVALLTYASAHVERAGKRTAANFMVVNLGSDQRGLANAVPPGDSHYGRHVRPEVD